MRLLIHFHIIIFILHDIKNHKFEFFHFRECIDFHKYTDPSSMIAMDLEITRFLLKMRHYFF